MRKAPSLAAWKMFCRKPLPLIRVRCRFSNLSSMLSTRPAAHVGFCTPNFLALESTHTRAWQWELVTPALTIEQGHVLRPDRPGLGFELDEDAVRRRTGTPRPMDFWRRIVVE